MVPGLNSSISIPFPPLARPLLLQDDPASTGLNRAARKRKGAAAAAAGEQQGKRQRVAAGMTAAAAATVVAQQSPQGATEGAEGAEQSSELQLPKVCKSCCVFVRAYVGSSTTERILQGTAETEAAVPCCRVALCSMW